MSRSEELKKLDIRSRNQLRSILASTGTDAISRLGRLRRQLGKREVLALETVLNSPTPVKAAARYAPFPKAPPFKDALFGSRSTDLNRLLGFLEDASDKHFEFLKAQIAAVYLLDRELAEKKFVVEPITLTDHLDEFGWSHAILRRVVLVRECSETENDEIERLVWSAGLESNSLVVTSLIHAYAAEQNYLTVKKSTLNSADRGIMNRYSRALARLTFQPFAKDPEDLGLFLAEVSKCSLLDAIILIKVNSHLCDLSRFPMIEQACALIGPETNSARLIGSYDAADNESEYLFFKQCGAWLEYSLIRQYRVLLDHYYDVSGDLIEPLHPELQAVLDAWLGSPDISSIASREKITKHSCAELATLEASGNVTRSAIFNYWLHSSEGQIGLERHQILSLMGMTRDLAKTVPIVATRTASKLATEQDVRFILLLLLAKRSKNEKDSFQLCRLIERLCKKRHGNCLVEFVKSYEVEHPDIALYIYEITTEDFLAKCSGLAPHLGDIPELRARLHEWMARFSGNEFYIERARAVRIDHQLNRVRNEIDDHRIYVDPSRFSSWINDEVMADLNTALTVSGANKKHAAVSCDESLLGSLVQQCYSAFCSNPIFGIASYLGRRIRHGTFRGHLYSGVVNHFEGLSKYSTLRRDSGIMIRWARWKERYDSEISQIINDNLHVKSKQKPHGLLQPDIYSPQKLEIVAASVRTISTNYLETKSTENLDQLITDYCWRLAEADLQMVIAYLKSRQAVLKNVDELEEMVVSADASARRLAAEFKREVVHVIDSKLRAMYGWFKRPSNISPKASLALLYDAVVAEVKDTFPAFDPSTTSSDYDDIELIGGAYHVLYDSFYVVLFNAAKHGHTTRRVRRRFSISVEKGVKRLEIEIANSIKTSDCAEDVKKIIDQRKKANHDDATLYENRSGIPKLMQLAHSRKEFEIEFLDVIAEEVVVRFTYALEH
jgi:predicted CopG family antitoxin